MSRGLGWLALGAFVAGFVLAFVVFGGLETKSGGARAPRTADVGGAESGPSECDDPYSRFVGLHDGRVAVFAGQPGGCRVLLAVKPWSDADLPAFQREDLRRGIVFQQDDELFQIFEGLMVPSSR